MKTCKFCNVKIKKRGGFWVDPEIKVFPQYCKSDFSVDQKHQPKEKIKIKNYLVMKKDNETGVTNVIFLNSGKKTAQKYMHFLENQIDNADKKYHYYISPIPEEE